MPLITSEALSPLKGLNLWKSPHLWGRSLRHDEIAGACLAATVFPNLGKLLMHIDTISNSSLLQSHPTVVAEHIDDLLYRMNVVADKHGVNNFESIQSLNDLERFTVETKLVAGDVSVKVIGPADAEFEHLLEGIPVVHLAPLGPTEFPLMDPTKILRSTIIKIPSFDQPQPLYRIQQSARPPFERTLGKVSQDNPLVKDLIKVLGENLRDEARGCLQDLEGEEGLLKSVVFYLTRFSALMDIDSGVIGLRDDLRVVLAMQAEFLGVLGLNHEKVLSELNSWYLNGKYLDKQKDRGSCFPPFMAHLNNENGGYNYDFVIGNEILKIKCPALLPVFMNELGFYGFEGFEDDSWVTTGRNVWGNEFLVLPWLPWILGLTPSLSKENVLTEYLRVKSKYAEIQREEAKWRKRFIEESPIFQFLGEQISEYKSDDELETSLENNQFPGKERSLEFLRYLKRYGISFCQIYSMYCFDRTDRFPGDGVNSEKDARRAFAGIMRSQRFNVGFKKYPYNPPEGTEKMSAVDIAREALKSLTFDPLNNHTRTTVFLVENLLSFFVYLKGHNDTKEDLEQAIIRFSVDRFMKEKIYLDAIDFVKKEIFHESYLAQNTEDVFINVFDIIPFVNGILKEMGLSELRRDELLIKFFYRVGIREPERINIA